MRISTAVGRLKALPARSIVIAAVIAVGVAAAGCALPLLLPPQFTSFALLSSHMPANSLADSHDAGGPDLAGMASAILTDQLKSQPQDSPTSLNPINLSEAQQQIKVVQISPTELRLSYKSPDSSQSQPTVQAFADLLCLWRSPAKDEISSPKIQNPPSPQLTDLQQEREQALLRLTIAVLDTHVAEYRAGTQKGHKNYPAAQDQITRLLNQKKILLARLNESRQGDESRQSDPAQQSFASPAAQPFTLIQPATTAKQSSGFPPQTRIFAILTGIVLGLSYLALTLWRFRPVPDIAALQQLLPRQSLLIGAIGDFHQ